MARLGLIAALGAIAMTAACDYRGSAASTAPSEAAVTYSALPFFPRATTVRLHVLDGSGGSGPGDGKTLSAEQRRIFETAVRLKRTPPHADGTYEARAISGCFDPHHFFRYYSADGTQVGEVQVCFCCDGVRFAPEPAFAAGEDIEADFVELAKLVLQLGSKTEFACK